MALTQAPESEASGAVSSPEPKAQWDGDPFGSLCPCGMRSIDNRVVCCHLAILRTALLQTALAAPVRLASLCLLRRDERQSVSSSGVVAYALPNAAGAC